MNSTIDLSQVDHPACRDQLIEAIEDLPDGQTLTVHSDHDPEPVLLQYRSEQDASLDWEYEIEGPEEWILHLASGQESSSVAGELDVRDWPPAERHGTILAHYQKLEPGDSFDLVNDHDPKPLYYELRSLHGDSFDWEYLNEESGQYRVRITKTDESQPLPEDASTRVDVRVIPPQQRHKTIFHRFDLLAAGDAMEIVADHDPQPLRHQFRETKGTDTFEWEYIQEDPDEVRILLRKVKQQTGAEKDSGPNKEASPKDSEDVPELDVRSHVPQKRHDLVFEKYQSLEEGGAFLLVNDHDPKPLYYQMKEEMEGDLLWEYWDQGGDEWRILIGKQGES